MHGETLKLALDVQLHALAAFPQGKNTVNPLNGMLFEAQSL